MASIKKRETASGPRYDVQWRLPDGFKRKRTFVRKGEADNYVKSLAGQQVVGLVIDPNAAEIRLDVYIKRWLNTRLVRGRPLSPSTIQSYRALNRRNIEPKLGSLALRMITTDAVRTWHAELVASAGQDQAAKSYRLLHAILNTAVDDMRIGRNPCRIKGAGTEDAEERILIATTTVLELSDFIRYPYRALVLLAGLGGLRTGESLGLRRQDVDPLRQTVSIRRQAQELTGLGRIEGTPKSDAGKRTVVLPRSAMEALVAHMDSFTSPDPDAVVFTATGGGPLRRARVSEASTEAKAIVGAPADLHMHDLRHHAATLMARMPGVTTKELMARIGHASPRAALIYQHATEERDRAIADFLDARIAESKVSRTTESGASITAIRRA
jgi:integrase